MTTHEVKASGTRATSSSLRQRLLALLAEGDAHAYELGRKLVAEGHARSVRRGGVYHALRRMESDELVSSEWDFPSSGPARRVYTITERGLGYVRPRRLPPT